MRLLGCCGILAAGIAAMVLSWSLLSVSGNGLAVRLSLTGEGEGMGVFNAVTAMANALGAGLGRWAAVSGSRAAVILAIIGIAGGLGLAGRLWRTSWESGIRCVQEKLLETGRAGKGHGAG